MPSTEYAIEFSHPNYLLGLLALIWIVFVAARSLAPLGRSRQIALTLVRSLSLLVLVLALAGMSLISSSDTPFVVFAIDESESIGINGKRYAEEFVQAAQEGRAVTQSTVIRFANGFGRMNEDDRDVSQEVESTLATNLANAVQLATANIPASYAPHIVLLTDGLETQGNVMQTALADDVPVSTVCLPESGVAEVQVASVNAPFNIRSGQPFFLEVALDASQASDGVIELYEDNHMIVTQKQHLEAGENRLRFRHSVPGRQARMTVRLREFPDTRIENNSASAFIYADGEPRALVVYREAESTQHLRWALDEEGIDVELRPVAGLPEEISELDAFQLVILADVPAFSLSDSQVECLRQYVEQLGGGLVVIGGEQSFGLGGYYGSALEAILPLRSDFEREEEEPGLSMVLAIDRSGSMTGEKIELAKDAAEGAVELLGANDEVGVLAFEGDAFWISDIHPATDKNYILERIGRLSAGGGTNLYDALNEAFLALGAANSQLKHCIVLSDGNSTPGDFDALVGAMRAAQITVSTVAVGQEADRELLQRIADNGRGRHYYCEDATAVPQVFARETIAASRSALHEEPFLPLQVRATQILTDIDFDEAPFLLGFVATRPKASSEIILTTDSGEPLLATWRFGLGTTVAFTSDAASRWAAEWLDWPGYSRFWAQVARHAMRTAESPHAELVTRQREDAVHLRLDATDRNGEFVNGAATEVVVFGGGESAASQPLSQTAPGRYEAILETTPEESTQFQVRQSRKGRPTYRASRAIEKGYPEELRLRPPNTELLRQLALVTGGQFNPAPDAVFQPLGKAGQAATPLWKPLLILAGLLGVLDVALRRVGLSGTR